MARNTVHLGFVLLIAWALCPAQPDSRYLPRRGKGAYLANYNTIRSNAFCIDFAARQFRCVVEQANGEGRAMRAITPNLPVLAYQCFDSWYVWLDGYRDILNPDERSFMHACDPAVLRVSRRGSQAVISWANDRRFIGVTGYRLRIAADSAMAGTLAVDTLIRGKLLALDSAACAGKSARVSSVDDSGREMWYGYPVRVRMPAPGRDGRYFLDSVYAANYPADVYTVRPDSLFIRLRVDSGVAVDSVVLQLNLDHDRDLTDAGERFALTASGPYWSGFWTWDRAGFNAGTVFRILVCQPGWTDTLPGDDYVMNTDANNRFRHSPAGDYHMNPNSRTWQVFSAGKVAARLSGPDYSGVFTDNTSPTINFWLLQFSKAYEYTDSIWMAGMVGMLRTIDSVASGAPVIFNGLGGILTGVAYLPYATGGMNEGWLMTNWSSAFTWGVDYCTGLPRWTDVQNQVIAARNTYHRVYCPLNHAPADSCDARLYVYGSYLLTCDDSVWYTITSGSCNLFAHWPEMNLYLGSPTVTAQSSIGELRHANGYYVRTFERGVVLVNPTQAPVTLSGSYPGNMVALTPATTLNGGRLYTVPATPTQIPSHRALVLLNAPMSSPDISSLALNPARPAAQGTNLITARVSGLQPLYVEGWLADVGGPGHVAMNDQGLAGDAVAGDSIYTGTYTVSGGSAADSDTVRVSAYDTTGLVTVMARSLGSVSVAGASVSRAHVAAFRVSSLPGRAGVSVRYATDARCSAQLTVLDQTGRQVRVLVDREQSAGPRAVVWDGANACGRRVASGVYFVSLTAGGSAWVGTPVLVR